MTHPTNYYHHYQAVGVDSRAIECQRDILFVMSHWDIMYQNVTSQEWWISVNWTCRGHIMPVNGFRDWDEQSDSMNWRFAGAHDSNVWTRARTPARDTIINSLPHTNSIRWMFRLIIETSVHFWRHQFCVDLMIGCVCISWLAVWSINVPFDELSTRIWFVSLSECVRWDGRSSYDRFTMIYPRDFEYSTSPRRMQQWLATIGKLELNEENTNATVIYDEPNHGKWRKLTKISASNVDTHEKHLQTLGMVNLVDPNKEATNIRSTLVRKIICQWERFCLNSSIHGMKYLVDSRLNWLERYVASRFPRIQFPIFMFIRRHVERFGQWL